MKRNIRIQDDLYQAVNGEWLASAVIPSDRPVTGGFSDLDQEVEKTLMADFAKMAQGKQEIDDITGMQDALLFYRKALNDEARNQAGIAPLLPLLEKITSLHNFAEFQANIHNLWSQGVPLPLSAGVQPDMKNALQHCFVLQGPGLILPDTTYYAPDNQAGKKLLKIYEKMASALLKYTPLDESEQKKYIEDTLAFDALVAKRVKSQLEWADYVKDYNPMSLHEVEGYVAPFALHSWLESIYGKDVPETLIVRDPRAIREFSLYFTEATFPLYLHWAYVKTLVRCSSYLSEEIVHLGHEYRRQLTGVTTDPAKDKQAYRMTSDFFAEPIGVYYGRRYFGEEAKKDIVHLVQRIISTYKVRIQNNRFLEESTKAKAILKLSTIKIKMGYPDEVDPFYQKMQVQAEDSFFASVQKLLQIMRQHEWSKLTLPVNKNEWAMPGHMVNACYDPSSNDITFPAAILQKPFYSIQQSLSENLGGIGAVIGHEISHAFDNNGAHFDENGNLTDWWTKKDYAAFKELTQKMIDQFEGIAFHGGKVSGALVVSENIADNGGMAVTLHIMREIENPDWLAYFKNWARVWCRKAKEEYIQLLLVNDVHAPAELRANMQPRNFPEWYACSGATQQDQMYLAPEKRIVIW